MRVEITTFLSLLAAAAAITSTTTPPCHTPLNPEFETLCFSTTSTVGNISVRVLGAGLDGVLVTGMSTPTNFSAGAAASAVPVFEYFLSDNGAFTKVPLTVPLMFRPDPAGTWLSSFALPTSVYPTASAAPSIIPGADLRFEEFSPAPGAGRKVAALTFYTIQVAAEEDYAQACGVLEAALPGMGLTPVEGAWRVAWVTYTQLAMVGDMVSECWVEVE